MALICGRPELHSSLSSSTSVNPRKPNTRATTQPRQVASSKRSLSILPTSTSRPCSPLRLERLENIGIVRSGQALEMGSSDRKHEKVELRAWQLMVEIAVRFETAAKELNLVGYETASRVTACREEMGEKKSGGRQVFPVSITAEPRSRVGVRVVPIFSKRSKIENHLKYHPCPPSHREESQYPLKMDNLGGGGFSSISLSERTGDDGIPL